MVAFDLDEVSHFVAENEGGEAHAEPWSEERGVEGDEREEAEEEFELQENEQALGFREQDEQRGEWAEPLRPSVFGFCSVNEFEVMNMLLEIDEVLLDPGALLRVWGKQGQRRRPKLMGLAKARDFLKLHGLLGDLVELVSVDERVAVGALERVGRERLGAAATDFSRLKA
jgi:hypothetical protein